MSELVSVAAAPTRSTAKGLSVLEVCLLGGRASGEPLDPGHRYSFPWGEEIRPADYWLSNHQLGKLDQKENISSWLWKALLTSLGVPLNCVVPAVSSV